ncbi:MAG: lipid IV(A) palmitoyltransferase PagP [Vogesella sp.]|uniref:lipid IV(A) palmitoyltransferase PagP n=1 Tax=Vogesella sp. TaxID=1904252 RepID=UPI00391DDDD3
MLASSAHAVTCGNSDSWLDKGCRRAEQVMQQGETGVYVTGYAYHLRSMYSEEKIKSFNERAWGGGIGKSLYDEDGDWHGVYAIAFLDSHKHVEPAAGYAYQSMVPIGGRWQLGGGFTAFLTSRTDTLKGFPVPVVLPLASLQYRKSAVMASFMPGPKGNGNVLFVFGRIAY